MSPRLSLSLLAAAMVVGGCEPISFPKQELPLELEDVDERMTPWGVCEGGWQTRTVLPLGTKANPDFGLDADGHAYFLEYGDDLVRVVTTRPGRRFEKVPWMGMYPWIGGVRVDAQGEVHLAVSPQFQDGSASVPTYFFHSSQGGWLSERLVSGWVHDFDMDAQGGLHALTVMPVGNYPMRHIQGPPEALVTEEPFVVLQNRDRMHSLRVDDKGHAHVVYQFTGLPRTSSIQYATNASGSWVTEQIAPEGNFPLIAVTPSGTPHVVWNGGGDVWLGVRRAEGGWDVSQTGLSGASPGAMTVSDSGEVHLLHESGKNLDHWVRSERGWEKTTLSVAGEDTFAVPFSASHLELDARGRVHAIYGLVMEVELNGENRVLKRFDYTRQCP
ncbi:hypothetical protein [Myxococcus stipitatus]|uniref:hypothetical protein n=1 Tax=Myxococcus stipitatus TaxID=83455 RepID=UPI000318B8EA|nr:hypothetical protein [Myxococcus stipitatus]